MAMEIPRFTINLASWGKLIATRLIREHGLAFPYGQMEDLQFFFRAMFHANKYVATSDLRYIYRQVSNSLIHGGTNRHYDALQTFEDILYRIEEIIGEMKESTQVSGTQERAIYDYFLESALVTVWRRYRPGDEAFMDSFSEGLQAAFGKPGLYIGGLLRLLYPHRNMHTEK